MIHPVRNAALETDRDWGFEFIVKASIVDFAGPCTAKPALHVKLRLGLLLFLPGFCSRLTWYSCWLHLILILQI